MTALVSHAAQIAAELKVNVAQLDATIRLFDEGATVPFVARYRKEVTGGLSDVALRYAHERLEYLRTLDERRESIINAIKEQDKLTPELLAALNNADTKTRLEDLYLPYRPKKRTKAQIATEAGLLPFADSLLTETHIDISQTAQKYLNEAMGFETEEKVIEGARQIIMERFSEDAALLDTLREYVWLNGKMVSKVLNEKHDNAKKFKDYFQYLEPLKNIPSHRALALFRGRREGILQLAIILDDEKYLEDKIALHFSIIEGQLGAYTWLKETVTHTWKIKLFTKIELELFSRIRELADEEAIKVFAKNLKDLLMAAPAGAKVTMGLDPGIRTGVKVIVVDATGKLLDATTVYPLQPNNDWFGSIAELAKLCAKYQVELISIGNGTGSRETERLVEELLKTYKDLTLLKVVVSEAGASVYSASPLASEEFPDLDVSLRGAVSIARRLQDPLAELVKIDPKSIGVGQYQHDVNQTRLAKSLEGVVEDCVNWVGVDVNTASIPLLTHISGLNEGIAKQIVQYRDENGPFKNREALRAVPRLGDKTFEQAAGFLRVLNGDNALDKSGVHPESYPVVNKILSALNTSIDSVMKNPELLKAVNASEFIDEHSGLLTVQDILKELEKPGRDPRPEFKMAKFKPGIEEIAHLQLGMILEGVVTNVTNFGAFVDVGVHQDGLVHISMLTNKFISDPHQVVKAGEIVTVKVTEVDVARKRIGLSMRMDTEVTQKPLEKNNKLNEKKFVPAQKTLKTTAPKSVKPNKTGASSLGFNTAMADAFKKLQQGK